MKVLFATTFFFCGLSYLAFAQTWTQTSAPNASWAGVASSVDGSKLIAACDPSGGIYTSTNSGLTWISNAVPAVGWNSVASSADGSLLAAGSASAGVYVSTNGGAVWTQAANVTGLLPGCVTVSANGDIMFDAAAGGTNFFFISTNAGVSWTSNSSPALQQIASSADATKLVAAGEGIAGPIYTSPDSGITWISNNVSPQRSGIVASSADGKTLAAASHNSPGVIFTSTNFGSIWTPANVPNDFWESLALSADGTKLVAAGYNRGLAGFVNLIYTSTNSGVSWVSNSPASSQNFAYGVFVASSADGNKLVMAVSKGGFDTGGIYTSFAIPAPHLNLTSLSGNLDLSWIIPSTNFVLQQSSNLVNWAALTNAPALDLTNLQNEVFLLPTNDSAFFRLISQ